MLRRILVPAIACLALAACGAPADDTPTFTAEDEAAVRAVVQQWAVNTSENRFIDNLEIYAPDAKELLAEPVEGIEAIRARWEEFLPNYTYKDATVEVRELVGMGDLAYVWADFHERFDYLGEPRVRDGSWMILLKRQPDGSWAVHRNAWMAASRADSTDTE